MLRWFVYTLACWLWLVPSGVVVGHLAMRVACKRPFSSLLPIKVWNCLVKVVVATLIVEWLLSRASLSLWGSSSEPVDYAIVTNGTFVVLYPDGSTRKDSKVLAMWLVRVVLGFGMGLYLGESVLPVALTGSIATGKSTVARILTSQEEDAIVTMIDLDKIAHDILLPTSPDSVYAEVVKVFASHDILQDSGRQEGPRLIDRPKLGAIVFAESNKRRTLNRITHSRIRTVMLKQILIQSFSPGVDIVLVDVPLLYESGWVLRALFGVEIVVACTPDLQYDRLRKRNPDLTPEQCRQRISSQIPVHEKGKKADICIWNNASQEELQEPVLQVRQELHERIHGGQSGQRLCFWVAFMFAVNFLYYNNDTMLHIITL